MTNPAEQELLDSLGVLLLAARRVRAAQVAYLQNAYSHSKQIRDSYSVAAGDICAAIAVDGTITVAQQP